MKKLFLMILSFLFISCNSQEKSIEKSVKLYLEKNNPTDLKSYKSIETILTDTIYTQELAEEKIKDFEHTVQHFQDNIKDAWSEKMVEAYQAGIKSYNADIKTLKSLKEGVEYYVFKHKFQIKNSNGLTTTKTLNILTNPDYKVLFVHNYGVDGKAANLFYDKYNIKLFDLSTYHLKKQ